MFNDIISLDNLFIAWREFRRGKRDKSDVQIFEYRLEDNIFALYNELRDKKYRHGFYERFHIFDPKHRIIHKALVRDRIVHHALCRVLSPLFEQSFIFDSYSCRSQKGTHAAVERLEQFALKVSRNYTRPCWALKCDVRKFFDSIDHRILMAMLSSRISDSNTLWLLSEIIGSYPSVDNFSRERERESKGLPIGNLTSQLFANIYLNSFDHFVKEKLRVKYYIRYTDDFVILHENPAVLISLLPIMREYLRTHLALELHPKKVILRKLRQGIDFLGYIVFPHYRILRAKTRQRMMRRVANWQPGEFATIESYLGMIKHCNGYGLSKQLRECTLYNECWRHGIMYPW